MQRRHYLPVILTFLLGLCLALPLLAADAPPAEVELKNKIQSLQQRDPDANSGLISIYEEALRFLNDGNEYQEQSEEYQRIIQEFPELSAPLKQSIADYEEPDYPDIGTWSQSQLDQELADRTRQLNELTRRKRLQNQTLQQIENRVSYFNGELSDLRFNLLATEQELSRQHNLETSGPYQEARTVNLQLKEEAISRHIQMLELEQLSAGERSELARLRANLIVMQQESLTGYINELRNEQRELRRAISAQAVADSMSLDHPLIQQTPRLADAVRHNLDLTRALEDVGRRQDAVIEMQEATEQQLNLLDTSMANFKEQVAWMKVSRAFAEDLRNRLKNLPDEPPLAQLEHDIIENRVSKYRFEQQREQLKIDIQTPLPELDIEQQELMAAIYSARKDLLENLLSRLDNLIYSQANLKLSYSQLDDKIRQIKLDADEHMFWVANAEPINLEYPVQLVKSVVWLFQPEHLLELPQAFLLLSDPDRILYGLLFIALGYLAYLGKQKQPALFKRWADKTRRITTDKLRYTWYCLFFSYLTALPVPTMVFTLGWLFEHRWQLEFVPNLGVALQSGSYLLVLYQFIRNLAQPNGLLQAHFRWDMDLIQPIFKLFRRVIYIIVPLYVIAVIGYMYQDKPQDEALGRLAFILLAIALSWFFTRLSKSELPISRREKSEERKIQIASLFFWSLLIFLPALMAILAIMGYFSTARTLLQQMELSLLIGMGLLLLHYLIRRWMLLQKRRIAFERAKTRRAEILAQRAREVTDPGSTNQVTSSETDLLEEPEIDLDVISAQSLGLVRTLLILLYIALLFLVWSELNTAFGIFDNVTLWTVTDIGGTGREQDITLGNLFMAIFVFSLTTLLVRNLPGALELLILQHLSLTAGTGFAITTIAKYFVILTGSLIAFSIIGIDWSKTQWLVAALTVGLGFGLQEIFANFVSGLIILFEKPIRIGDTVTIRDLTGNISKIQTRATTIVDWDRKEIIVPNKAFITEQFINWSLSDSVTRLIIKIGVSHNSDPEQVTNLLTEATEESTLALETPAPEVFFLGIGANSLEFEVRVYAAEMAHRLNLSHEMHSIIKRKLGEQQVTIAYPQLDVHLNKSR